MKEDIREIKKLLDEHGKRISRLEAMISKQKPKRAVGGTEKEISIKEFILSKNPSDKNMKTLCIAYYLEKYTGFSLFNVEDIKKGFRSAKEPPPGNINDRVNQNIAKGLMMEAEEKKDNRKAWVLTSSGEKIVENELGKEKGEAK